MPETSEKGLTAAEVAALTESGQVNAVKSSTSRSFADIVRANVFTLFNGIIFAAMVMVLVTGSWRDAVFGLVILINTGIGIITELKAKRTLDKLSILVASDYLVRRDGKDVEVPHNEIVLGDLMWIRSGEQVPADAQIVRTWGLELDESMLTGESRTVRKNEGDDIYSGSTAVSGMALVKVNAVGAHSYAATLTAQAKVYKKTVSDLNKGINTILKFMTFLVVPLCVLLIWSQVHAVGGWDVAISTGQWRSAVVSAVAGVVGMIPEGLVLLTSLNFALAAIRLARKNTLVQELESVETLARVDCLNLDKTGTVTDGGIMLNEIRMLDGIGANTVDEHAVKQALYDLSNEGQPNGTGLAILNGLGKQGFSAGPVAARVPFSSARKWSSIADDGAVWTMGAPEVVLSHLDGDYADVLRLVNDSAHDGNRVLLIARHDGKAPADYESDPAIDPASRPVALVLCSEHIRDDAEATLAWFREQGVRCRIISGDNPVTVGAIARKVRLTGDAEPRFMDARKLPADITELAKVLENVDVLGRVLPDQKKAIVQALHLGDHVVAMTGDGVNDALAIKEADLGIAMGNAAPATKAVAQVVLVDSKFSHLPDVVARGRQVMANMERVASLFLVKTVYSALISLGVVLTQIPFPIPAPPYHLHRRTHHRHAGVHPRACAEHAPLHSGLPQARGALRIAGRHRHGSVDSRRFVAVAEVHGLGRTAFRRAAGHASWRQRDYPADDGHLRTGARGPAAQLVERRSGIGVRRGGRGRHVHSARRAFLRARDTVRRNARGDGRRACGVRHRFRAVPMVRAENGRHFLTFQEDTPVLK